MKIVFQKIYRTVSGIINLSIRYAIHIIYSGGNDNNNNNNIMIIIMITNTHANPVTHAKEEGRLRGRAQHTPEYVFFKSI